MWAIILRFKGMNVSSSSLYTCLLAELDHFQPKFCSVKSNDLSKNNAGIHTVHAYLVMYTSHLNSL